MRKIGILLFAFFCMQCNTDSPLSEKADAAISGTIYPGIASGEKGHIAVVVSTTNNQEQIDWETNADHLTTFGEYKVEELVAGKYYVITHMDQNGNGERDRDEFWGGYDANGDGRLDAVSVIGGETTIADITFFDIYD